jgi:hypothetical protein
VPFDLLSLANTLTAVEIFAVPPMRLSVRLDSRVPARIFVTDVRYA